jgi:hypothetical protein
MKLGLCPKPRFGGNSSTARRFGLGQTLQEDASQQSQKKILELPFDFGAAHARGYSWVISRRGRLGVLVPLGPMRIKHLALSELDMRR